jgi:hypothetical protein
MSANQVVMPCGEPTRPLVWRAVGWALAVGAVIGWVVLLHAPGTLPWLFVATAGVGMFVLTASVWSTWPRGGQRPEALTGITTPNAAADAKQDFDPHGLLQQSSSLGLRRQLPETSRSGAS